MDDPLFPYPEVPPLFPILANPKHKPAPRRVIMLQMRYEKGTSTFKLIR